MRMFSLILSTVSADTWQEDDFDLVTVIKGACFYRRSKQHDYISDYMPPTATEFKKIVDSYK